MFNCDYRKLTLSFNEFCDMEDEKQPEYGEFCLLELKDKAYTAGKWNPGEYDEENSAKGKFIRGTADTVSSTDVARWQSLDRYDLSDCLEDESVTLINMEEKKEGVYSAEFSGFKSFKDNDFPKSEQYCLLILTDGSLAAGRWDKWDKEDEGCFIYAPALSSYNIDKVWAWKELSPDQFFEMEEERENEKKKEEELNKDPSIDPDMFRYGIDIETYYEKALEKLRKEYPWATLTQMKKKEAWNIVPLHGNYVFGQVSRSYWGDVVSEWKDGTNGDEFIDFLCEYTKQAVEDSDPEKKFRFGLDIDAYLSKAFEKVKKDYRWVDREMLKKRISYDIKKIDGDYEFVEKYGDNEKEYVCDCASSEEFIERVESDYQREALWLNQVVDSYAVKFGHIVLRGWNLERYDFMKLESGDYKVNVQAGDRVTGGNREFLVTPYCFEADSYEEFLDRYLQIVPGDSFGLYKEDLLKDEKLKKFLGY